jgi:hypothetical protein
MGKFVFDKSIKIDEEKRKELKEKKKFEKNEAERDLYSFVNNIEQQNDNRINQVKKIESATTSVVVPEPLTVAVAKPSTSFNKSSDIRNQMIDQTKPEFVPQESRNDNAQLSISKKGNEIFDEKNLEKNNLNEQSSVRQSTNIKVNLTEKLIPHFAARESLSKEPPYPKSKKYVPEKNMVLLF